MTWLAEAAAKKCGRCQVSKPLSDFHTNKSVRDGRTNYCKACANEAAREWYKKNKSKALANAQAWRKKNPEKRRLNKRRNRLRHPEKKLAGDRRYNERNREKRREYMRDRAAALTDGYVRFLICNSGKLRIPSAMIPQPLVEAARVNIQIKRLLKERKQ